MLLFALGKGVLAGAAVVVVLGAAFVLYVLKLFREAKARILAEREAAGEPDPTDPLFQAFERNRRENEARVAAEVAGIPDGDPFKEWVRRGGTPTWFDVRPDVQFLQHANESENPQKVRAVAFGEASNRFDFRNLPALPHPVGVDLSERTFSPRDFEQLAAYPTVSALVVFNNSTFDDKCLKAVGSMAGLTHVQLDGSSLTARGLEPLTRLSRLELLRLAPFDMSEAVGVLERMPQLRSLDFSGFAMTDEHYPVLRRLTRLAALRIQYAGGVSAAGFRNLQALTGLEHLSVQSSGVDGDKLEPLSVLTGLTTLSLALNTELTGPDLRHLGPLVRLRKLDLGNTTLGKTGLSCLDPLRSLESLNLRSSGITDANLLELPALPKLRTLDLSTVADLTDRGLARAGEWRPLEHLEMTNTPVGDAGVAHLAGLPNLRYLRLQGTRVTAACFDTLASLPNLSELTLACTNITDAEALRLAEMIPDCVIRHSYQRPN